MLLLCTCVLGILSYEQICPAARDHSQCVRLHSRGMRPAAYCLPIRIGIPNENHDITEQISSDTINFVDGYRLRTDHVVRATCIRGVRSTAVCVISSTEYTRSISTAIILQYALFLSKVFILVQNWKTSAVSTTAWMVETQLCKLRGTSDIYTNYRSRVFYVLSLWRI